MRPPSILAAPLLLMLLSACRTGPEPERFGAPLADAGTGAVPVAELLATPERYDGQRLTLEGSIDAVCPKKGCWITLSDGARELRVTFQDYGFFVPLDAGGASLRAEGVFRVEETPVDEARHYLEDAGRHAEAAAITAPVTSYAFVASGVELLRE